MGSIKKVMLLLVTMVIACFLSCKDELPRENTENPTSGEGVSVELDKGALYRYQTNKDIILNSLIRYDYNEEKYILDTTSKDAEKLGISADAYNECLNRVEQMNQINIEHQ